MQSIDGNVCSICSEVFCSSKRMITVDEDVIQLLKFLFIKVNCSALQDTQVCGTCLENIHNAFNFKMVFVKQRTLNIASKIEQIDTDISCICQICKEIIQKSSSTSYTKDLKLVIHHLIDEIRTGVEATEDSRICVSCEESVVNFQSVIKLLSSFNEERTGNVKSENESLDIESKIAIKEEPLMEYSEKNVIMQIEPMQIDIKKEVDKYNEINSTYEDFIIKNEEVDVKSECEESDSTEQMWEVSEEHNTINFSNLAAQHFTVGHKNDKNASRSLETYIACDPCDYKAKQKAHLKNHMLIHKNIDEIKMFTCDVCDYKAKVKGDLKNHILKHKSVDETEMFTCDVCYYKTKHKGVLKTHMLIHKNIDDIQMYICDVCGYKTKHKGSLKIHKLIHRSVDEIEMFACDACDYKTKQKSNLKRHMLKHKNVDEIKMFTCDVCEHKTKHKGSLKKHMLKHKNADEIKMFTCDICSLTTKYKSSLKMHMLQHKNVDSIKMFSCGVCDYKIKRKQCLKRHMLQHKNISEIQMFPCDICSYTTNRKSSLKIHMLKHKNMDEIKMFPCDVCDYKAKRKTHLKNHMLIHKNSFEIKMFSCDICDYKTKRKGDLQRHMLRHKNIAAI